MKNLFKGLKQNLGGLIGGIVAILAGLVAILAAGAIEDASNIIVGVGIVILLAGIVTLIATISIAKDFQRTHCDECGKLITGCAYELDTTTYQNQFDSTGKFTGVKLNYVVSVQCPYCGNNDTWEGSSTGKTLEQAIVHARKRIDNLYRKTTSTYAEFIDAIKAIESGEEFEFDADFPEDNYLQMKPNQYKKYVAKFEKQCDKYATKIDSNTYKRN